MNEKINLYLYKYTRIHISVNYLKLTAANLVYE